MSAPQPPAISDDQIRNALARRPDPVRMTDDLALLFAAIEETRQRRSLTARLATRWTFPRTTLAFVALVATLVALLLALSLIVGAHHRLPPPYGLARPGLIAVDEGSHIVVLDPGGGAPTKLTTGSNVDNNAIWSPDGTKIAFESRQEDLSVAIVVMNADGSHPVAVADHLAAAFGVAWSPDSRRLVFGARAAGSDAAHVYIGDADRADAQPLGASDMYGVEPAWSPDGRTIAFKRLYNAGGGNASGALLDQRDLDDALWLIDAEGTHPRQLTSTRGEYAALWKTAWSPDSKRLAFWADGVDGKADVFVINADRTGEQNLSNSPSPVDDMWPSWSPDGTRIAYVHTDPAAIVVVDPDGANGVTLEGPPIRADPMTNCGGVVWSPDGKRLLAVATGPDGATATDVIAIFDVPGQGHQTAIPAAGVCSFSWQRLAR